MKPPKKVGEMSQAYFIAICLERGWVVSQVVGDCERYDCVLDMGDGLKRIQIKTGKILGGSLVFSCASSTYHVPEGCATKHSRQGYKGQIDFFGVYSPELKKSYLVPVEEVGIRSGALRIDVSKNNQKSRMAQDFEI